MFIRKNHFYIIIAFIVVLMALVIFYFINNESNLNNDNDEVVRLVEEFGSTLKNVSLLAPRDLVIEAIEENYTPYVTDELLQNWINHPRRAPGKTTSSPWPDRIEITDVNRVSDDEYFVKGRIAEITSEDANTAAAYRPIELTITRTDSKWLIDKITVYNYE